MSERNAPCPCGSGKKYKKCCLILAQSMKAQSSATYSGEAALNKMIAVLANNTIKNMEDAKVNEGKTFTLEHFQLLLDMACSLWNMSFLSSQRCKDLIDNNVEQSYYQREVKAMISKMRGNSQVSKLMVISATASERDGEDYPVTMESAKVNVEYIESTMESIIVDMLNAIDFMIEHSAFNEKIAPQK